MFKPLQTAILSASLLLGSFVAVPAVQAEGLRITINPQTVQYRHDRDRHDRHYRNQRGPRHGCTAERAVRKASRLGINRARVTNVGRNTISVRGFKRGERVRVLFARAPNCPVLR